MTEHYAKRAEKAEQRVVELELELANYVEVEEVNRSLVKRGDHYKAKAEAAEQRVAELEAALIDIANDERIPSWITDMIAALSLGRQ